MARNPSRRRFRLRPDRKPCHGRKRQQDPAETEHAARLGHSQRLDSRATFDLKPTDEELVAGTLGGMGGYAIRLFGDPVLRQRATEVDDVDGKLVKLVEGMIQAMYDAPGIGLAAPQVGVRKRLFVYDLQDDEGAKVVVNPVISETSGEWTYEEGCLSVPGLSWDIVRPKLIHLTGYDLDGNEVSVEADELTARLYQHELDHLDGTLLIDHLNEDQRKDALRVLRERILDAPAPDRKISEPGGRLGLHLPGLA